MRFTRLKPNTWGGVAHVTSGGGGAGGASPWQQSAVERRDGTGNLQLNTNRHQQAAGNTMGCGEKSSEGRRGFTRPPVCCSVVNHHCGGYEVGGGGCGNRAPGHVAPSPAPRLYVHTVRLFTISRSSRFIVESSSCENLNKSLPAHELRLTPF